MFFIHSGSKKINVKVDFEYPCFYGKTENARVWTLLLRYEINIDIL